MAPSAWRACWGTLKRRSMRIHYVKWCLCVGIKPSQVLAVNDPSRAIHATGESHTNSICLSILHHRLMCLINCWLLCSLIHAFNSSSHPEMVGSPFDHKREHSLFLSLLSRVLSSHTSNHSCRDQSHRKTNQLMALSLFTVGKCLMK